jgi:hypothetical protein
LRQINDDDDNSEVQQQGDSLRLACDSAVALRRSDQVYGLEQKAEKTASEAATQQTQQHQSD